VPLLLMRQPLRYRCSSGGATEGRPAPP